jgi:hypothetical protein
VSVLQDHQHISLSKCTEEHGDGVMSLKMPFGKNIGGEEDGGITSGICSVHNIYSFHFPRNFSHS